MPRRKATLSALEEQNALAVQVARLYYHQGLTSDEVARELAALGIAAHVGQGHAPLGRGHLFELHIDDFFQDVGHGGFSNAMVNVRGACAAPGG